MPGRLWSGLPARRAGRMRLRRPRRPRGTVRQVTQRAFDKDTRPQRARSRYRVRLKRLGELRPVQHAIGGFLAHYLRFVGVTSRVVGTEYPVDYAGYDVHANPVIFACWHGQNYLMPLYRRPDHPVAQLISRHRDGEIIAIAARKLGIDTIRGSGARDPALLLERGGMSAFLEMVEALKNGVSVAVTAEPPQRIARYAGIGTIKLAQASGAPIVPVAMAGTREIELNTWDRTTITLPFGRIAFAAREFIHVPADADKPAQEEFRQRLEAELNAAGLRARALLRGDK